MHRDALYFVCPRCRNAMEIQGVYAVCRVCGYRLKIRLFKRPRTA